MAFHSRTRHEALESRQLMAGDIAGVFGSTTSLVADINAAANTRITSALQLEDRLIVSALDGVGDVDIWSLDENSVSSVFEIDANFMEADSSWNSLWGCCRLTGVEDQLYMTVHNVSKSFDHDQDFEIDISGRTEIWETDGTPDGTAPLGINTVHGRDFWYQSVFFSQIKGNDGELVILANEWNDGEADAQLWTLNQARQLEKLGQTFNMNFRLPARDLIQYEDNWYFISGNGDQGYGLYRTNPNTGEMIRIARFGGSQVFGGGPIELTVFNGAIYFSDDHFGLWKSDGTAAGTVLVKQLHPGFGRDSGNGPHALTPTPEGMLFQTITETGNRNWITDGTADGTVELLASDPRSDWQAFWTVSTDEGLTGSRASARNEVGRFANRRLFDLDVSAISGLGPNSLIVQHEDLFFFGSLSVTDGTESGTAQLGRDLEVVGSYQDQVVIARDNELFTLNRESLSLVPFNDIPNTTPDSSPHGLVGGDDGVFFFNRHDSTLRFASTKAAKSHLLGRAAKD